MLLALPVVALAVGLEAWHAISRRDRSYLPEDAVASALVGVGHLWSTAGWRLLWLPLMLVAWSATPLSVPMTSLWSWALLFVLGDLVAYVAHRASHDVGLLWASHVVHHTSGRYNLSTALRQPWTAGLFEWVFWLPLVFLGFHPGHLLLLQGVQALYHVALHSAHAGSLGPLEHLLNTPTHHRLHHARDRELRETNFGAVLIVWDRLFGTHGDLGGEEPADFGLPVPLYSANPLVIAFHGWKVLLVRMWRARGVGEALGELAGAPDRGLERVE